MTKIRNFLRTLETRREQRLTQDTVSFEAFCNEVPPQRKCSITKESSLNGDFNPSPIKQSRCENYVRFSEVSPDPVNWNRFSLPAIFLVLILLFTFFILPLAYLLHCFGVLYLEERYQPPVQQRPENAETATVLPPQPKPDYNFCKLLEENDRFDCFPENGASKEACEARGCCWIPAKYKSKLSNSPLDVPYCFFPSNYGTYSYVNVTQTAFGLVAFLKRNYTTAYPDNAEFIQMTVKYETDTRLHVKITDPLSVRFEPPYPEVPIVDRAAVNLTYQFYMNISQSGFKVIRKSDNVVIFDSLGLSNLIFSNQFLQLSAKLPSPYIYGLGEHQSSFLLSVNWSRFTFFNHDAIPAFNKNGYGSHPFYLLMENSGKSHGVFLLNSNAMDVLLQPSPAITFRPIGGVLDLYFFLGPTPSDVLGQYTEVIGRPFLPPYWSLGFHLCRFGYKTLNQTKSVMQRNIDAGIPLDTQWNDIDYMIRNNDFTYDPVNFHGLPEFVKELHDRGMHYIPMVDPGVSGSEPAGTYPPFDIGVKMDIFVKNSSDQIFIGKVWNAASTVWPDFTHPNTVDYWTQMLRSFHLSVPYDGVWIDMNEPSNFLNGAVDGCPKSELDSPPYLPGIDGGQINYKTFCMSAKHFAGLHYNIHNLYGFSEAIVTNFALSEIRGKRPMIISRASFAGHGHYAGHWSGDVVSTWLDMKYSIPQLLSFSLFGIPLMGADICGFNGNTTEALCNRWMQLGAFYPFSRNHNTDDGIDQDPVAMGPQVTLSSKKALTIRYRFLPYLYTLFWEAHVNGNTVSRPLFFEFPNDSETYSIDTQFLWGPGLMIIPVLEKNAIQVTAYVPHSVWYDYYTKSAIEAQGKTVVLPAPLDTIPLLLRGGYIFPQQAPELTTTKSRQNKIELLATADEAGSAIGQLYWDDGDTLNSYEEKRYTLISFTMIPGSLTSENIFWGPENPPNLGSVVVLGIETPVSEVTVNKISQIFKYDPLYKFLSIENLNITLKTPIAINWK